MRAILLAVALTASLFAFFSSGRSDVGCGFDPSGCPETLQPGPDAGCGFDPDGCPETSQPVPDEGCIFDPSGCPKGS